MVKKILHNLLLVAMFIAAGCCTIIHGSKQKVSISSNPINAKVIIDGKESGKTPVIVLLSRKKNHTVELSENGYSPYKTILRRKVDKWAVEDIFWGGFIGLGIDALTGGLYNLVPIIDSAKMAKSKPAALGFITINKKDSSQTNVVIGKIYTQPRETFPKIEHDKSGRYAIFSASFGKSFYNKTEGTLTETFPYTSKNLSTGISTTQTFNATLTNPFSSNLFFIGFFNVEVVNKKHSIGFDIGVNSNRTDEYSFYFKGGYGRVLPIRFLKWNKKPFLLFKPSINLLYTLGYDESFGSIDNNNKEINLLGFTAGSQFTIRSTRGTSGGTYNVDVLDIGFKRSNFMVVPKISITNTPKGDFYWGIDASYLIPISQNSKLVLTQKADDENEHEKNLGRTKPNTNGDITTFNNVPFKQSPSIGGFYFGISAGIYIWPEKRQNKHL